MLDPYVPVCSDDYSSVLNHEEYCELEFNESTDFHLCYESSCNNTSCAITKCIDTFFAGYSF